MMSLSPNSVGVDGEVADDRRLKCKFGILVAHYYYLVELARRRERYVESIVELKRVEAYRNGGIAGERDIDVSFGRGYGQAVKAIAVACGERSRVGVTHDGSYGSLSRFLLTYKTAYYPFGA